MIKKKATQIIWYKREATQIIWYKREATQIIWYKKGSNSDYICYNKNMTKVLSNV